MYFHIKTRLNLVVDKNKKMSISQELITTITNLSTKTQHIRKDTRSFILDNFNELIKYIDQNFICDDDHIERLNLVIKILTEQKLNGTNRRKLEELVTPVKNTINQFKECFNKEGNEDVINDKMTVDEVEDLLNGKIPLYNKYTEANPMMGVSRDKTQNLWKYRSNNKTKTSKDLEKIIKIAQADQTDKTIKFFGKNVKKRSFKYKGHYFVTYWIDNEPYFDIQHIISVHNVKKTSWNDKYNEFKDKICFYDWHKNEHGGYILREFIDEASMYDLAMSSNSIFSKQFKKDVSQILVDMRKRGMLEIRDDQLQIAGAKDQLKVAKPIKMAIEVSKLDNYLYSNPNHNEYIKQIINIGSKIPITKYLKQHVLYAFIILINTPEKYVIIKFGYTEDIGDRIKTLATEYHTNVYLIGTKLIKGKSEEAIFHNLLKKTYPDLMFKHKIDNIDKTELYKFNPILLDSFFEYLNKGDNTYEDVININKLEMTINKKPYTLGSDNTDAIYYFNAIVENNKRDLILDKNKTYREIKLADREIRLADRKIELAKIKTEENKDKRAHELRLAEIELAKINANRSNHGSKSNRKPRKNVRKCFSDDSDDSNDDSDNSDIEAKTINIPVVNNKREKKTNKFRNVFDLSKKIIKL